MAANGVCLPGFFTGHRPNLIPSSPGRFNTHQRLCGSTLMGRVLVARNGTKSLSVHRCGRFWRRRKNKEAETRRVMSPQVEPEVVPRHGRKSLKDFFEEMKGLLGSDGGDGGPPRWFSPLDCGARNPNSPLLLFLPGIDGTGLGLIRHHRNLGKMFDIWCLHIPAMDRTPVQDIVKLIERTVRSENRFPNRPIYIVAESLGACLALAVAARIPDIDLVLILANPATSFGNSLLLPLTSLLEIISGDPLRMVMSILVKGFLLKSMFGKLWEDLLSIPSHLSVLERMFPKETLLWKLQVLKSAAASANSHLQGVRAQTLLLSSERDRVLPSNDEVERLGHALSKCEIRRFRETGHLLFLEDDFDLVTVIKGTRFYRRGKYHDFVSDYIQPTPFELDKVIHSYRWLFLATSPVMFSTLEDGSVVKGLRGIPSEGPVLYIGYHMLMGLEVGPLLTQFLKEKNIVLRGMGHPMIFTEMISKRIPQLNSYDALKLLGAIPSSASSLYKALSSKCHVLLYPGGSREALHRKGEEYKLFWPEHAEFVRMAAKFGAKIVPFGVVGEDDVGQVIFDYNDQMKVPRLKRFIEKMRDENVNVRADEKGEVANQDVHYPILLPKFPGRFYFYFGQPIDTAGRKHELVRSREKADELYMKIKSEVENCIDYLKEKRERDPYRNLLARVLYQARSGFSSQVPAFDP